MYKKRLRVEVFAEHICESPTLDVRFVFVFHFVIFMMPFLLYDFLKMSRELRVKCVT